MSATGPAAYPLEEVRALLDQTKREILAAIPKQDPRSWRLLAVVLPIVLTSVFGLVVFRVQSSVADRMDRESKSLQARLSLTQDYYRERLRIYQAIHEVVSRVEEKARTMKGSSVDEAALDNSVSALYRSYATNSIFLTKDLQQRLKELWSVGLDTIRKDTISKADAEKILVGIAGIEEQMRRDLLIDELTAQQGLLREEVPPQAAPAK